MTTFPGDDGPVASEVPVTPGSVLDPAADQPPAEADGPGAEAEGASFDGGSDTGFGADAGPGNTDAGY
jgi:hypothetical protein